MPGKGGRGKGEGGRRGFCGQGLFVGGTKGAWLGASDKGRGQALCTVRRSRPGAAALSLCAAGGCGGAGAARQRGA